MKNPKTTSLLGAAFAVVLLAALPRPVNPEHLLGRSPEDVIALFGVPDNASAGRAAIQFAYDAAEGAVGTFVFHDGVAVQVPAKGFEPALIKRPKPGQVFAGQSVAAAVALLGNPTTMLQGNHSCTLEYPNGSVIMLMNGRAFPATK